LVKFYCDAPLYKEKWCGARHICGNATYLRLKMFRSGKSSLKTMIYQDIWGNTTKKKDYLGV
jgi:hypothetical protein